MARVTFFGAASCRWADATGLNLNGGSFQFVGAIGYGSQQSMGTITVDKLSRIVILKGANAVNAGTAQLNIAGLSRVAANGVTGVGAGALLIQSQASGSLGIPASATISNPAGLAYDRLIITGTAPALGGSTSIGAGVTATIATAGMAAPWIINTNDSAGLPTFVTYSPSNYAGNTGFQPLVTTGSPGAGAVAVTGIFTPGANQVGYSKVFGTGTAAPAITAGALTAADTVDLSGAATLTLADQNSSVFALRSNRDLNPVANLVTTPTLTIVSGGLIMHSNTQIINNAPVPNNSAPQNMILNFGVGGASEAVIFTNNLVAATNLNFTINAQIVATGLTRSAPQNTAPNLILTGDNLLSGPVTIDGGILQAQNTLSGTGVAVPGVFNGQNVILGGSGTQANSGLRLDGTVYVEGTTTLGANDNYVNATFGVSNNVFGG